MNISKTIGDLWYSISYDLRYTYNPLLLVKRMLKHGILLRNFRINVKTLPASWADSDSQILHANFHILTEFVEVECSHLAVSWELVKGVDLKKSKKEKGFIYLDAYINDAKDEISKSSDPATLYNARIIKKYTEIKDLYTWWTITRPHRYNKPYVDLGFDVLEVISKRNEDREIFFKENPVIKKQFDKWRKDRAAEEIQDKKFDEEDTKYLIRLIKVRDSLWT